MKKIICLVLTFAMLAAALCSCGFNFDKEELSEYLTLGDYESFDISSYAQKYEEYRESIALKTAGQTAEITYGYTVDFKVTAETVTGEGSEAVYERYEPWCFDGDENYVKEYNFAEFEKNGGFDAGLSHKIEKVGDARSVVRTVKLGESFSFLYEFGADSSEKAVAGKTVRFTLNVLKVKTGISDNDIYSYIEKFFAACGYDKETAEVGDWVSVDFDGKIDGKAFNGGSAENYEILIGEGKPFDAFEAALLGHKKGDEFTSVIKFPEGYSDDTTLAGKEATFTISINEIYNLNRTVSDNTEYETVWQLKNAFRILNYAMSESVNTVMERSVVIAYPESLYRQYTKFFTYDMTEGIKSYATQYNCTEEQAYEELYGGRDDAAEIVKQNTEETCKEALTVYSLAKKLGIEYTNQNYKEDLENFRLFMQYSYGQTMTAKEIETQWTKDYLKMMFLYQTCCTVLGNTIMKASGIPQAEPEAE